MTSSAFAKLMNPAWEAAAHLLEIAGRLPRGRGEGKRLVVSVPPRHGKSPALPRLPAGLVPRPRPGGAGDRGLVRPGPRDQLRPAGAQPHGLRGLTGHVFTAPISPDPGGGRVPPRRRRQLHRARHRWGRHRLRWRPHHRRRPVPQPRGRRRGPRALAGAGVLPLDALHAADAWGLDRADPHALASRRPRRASPRRVAGAVGAGASAGDR